MPNTHFLPPLVLCVVCVAVLGCQPAVDPFATRKFDSTAWKVATYQQRAPMARDLICNHLPAGVTKSEVKDLLGEGVPIDAQDRQGETWSYYIGCWYEVGLDSAFVYVHFDVNGRLISAAIGGG